MKPSSRPAPQTVGYSEDVTEGSEQGVVGIGQAGRITSLFMIDVIITGRLGMRQGVLTHDKN